MWGVIGSFNPKFYPKIAKQSFAKSIGFLIIFVALIGLIISYKYTRIINKRLPQVISWSEENFRHIISGLPVIKIEDGELIFPREFFSKEWGKDFAFVIEPEDNGFYQVLEKYHNALVLGKRKIAIKTTEKKLEKAKIETYSLKSIKFLKITSIKRGLKVTIKNRDISITPYTIERFFEKLPVFIFPFLFIWFFLVYSFTKPLQVLLFSIISLIFNISLKASFSYRQLLNIGIYALVPSTILAVVGNLSVLRMPFFWILYSGIYILYLFLGMREIKRAEEVAQIA